MKAFFLVLLLLVSSASSAQALVFEQLANNNVGQFIRIINNSNQYASCYYRDAYNYFTFTIAPRTHTAWQPIYGVYIWECRYY
jgi:hypothetical protein